MASVLLLSVCSVLFACGGKPEGLPRGWLWQKGSYQTLYRPDRTIARLLQDRNADGRADTVIVYRDGVPRRAEIDTDLDGFVDRWEDLRADGSLERVGFARRTRGKPDLWEYVGPDGRVGRTESDEDGDGRPDRIETRR